MTVGNVVYVSGALSDVPETVQADYIKFYERIGCMIASIGLTPYVPHWNTDPVKHKDVTPKQVDLVDRCAVTSSMLVVAVADNPSLGVGVEVEMAYHAHKPVALLCKKELVEARKISRLVRGNPAVIAEIVYETFDEAIDRLESFLRSHLQSLEKSILPEVLIPKAVA